MTGKVALVTGASGDIGLQLSGISAYWGCIVYAGYRRNREALDRLNTALETSDMKIFPVQCDITVETDRENLLSRIRDEQGGAACFDQQCGQVP